VGPGHLDPVRVTLTGLSRAGATALIRRRWPEASDQAAGRLWEHTGGNPLYVQALLAEYDPPRPGRGPRAARRDLHRRAAEVVTEPHAMFIHRIAAADQYDEPLAQALESAAAGCTGSARSARPRSTCAGPARSRPSRPSASAAGWSPCSPA
jgi:hypothetical protein